MQLLANLNEKTLDLLVALFPPRETIHVGPGGRFDHAFYEKTKPLRTYFIEADQSLASILSRKFEGCPDQFVFNELVAEKCGSREYYFTSHKGENGIISPAALTSIWQNISVVDQAIVQSTTLDNLFAVSPDAERMASEINWVIVECLASPLVLDGAKELLKGVELIIARTINIAGDTDTSKYGQAALDAGLTSQGFNCIKQIAGHHPAIQTSVYARDWRRQSQKLSDDVSQLVVELEETKNGAVFQNARIDDLDSRNQVIESEAARLREQVANLNDAILQGQERLQEKDACIKQMEGEVQALKSALEESNQQLRKFREDQLNRVKEFEQALERADTEMKAALKARALIQSDLADLRDKYNELTKKYHSQLDVFSEIRANLMQLAERY